MAPGRAAPSGRDPWPADRARAGRQDRIDAARGDFDAAEASDASDAAEAAEASETMGVRRGPIRFAGTRESGGSISVRGSYPGPRVKVGSDQVSDGPLSCP